MKKFFTIWPLFCVALTGCAGTKSLDTVETGLIPKGAKVAYVSEPGRDYCPTGAGHCGAHPPAHDDMPSFDVVFTEKVETVDRTGSRIAANIGWFALALKANAPFKSLSIQDGWMSVLTMEKKGEDPVRFTCSAGFEDCRKVVTDLIAGNEVETPTVLRKRKVKELREKLAEAEQTKKDWAVTSQGYDPNDKFAQNYARRVTEDLDYQIRYLKGRIDDLD